MIFSFRPGHCRRMTAQGHPGNAVRKRQTKGKSGRDANDAVCIGIADATMVIHDSIEPVGDGIGAIVEDKRSDRPRE